MRSRSAERTGEEGQAEGSDGIPKKKDWDKRRRRQTLGQPPLSLLRDEGGSARNGRALSQGRVRKRRVLPLGYSRSPDAAGGPPRAARDPPRAWPHIGRSELRDPRGSRPLPDRRAL